MLTDCLVGSKRGSTKDSGAAVSRPYQPCMGELSLRNTFADNSHIPSFQSLDHICKTQTTYNTGG